MKANIEDIISVKVWVMKIRFQGDLNKMQRLCLCLFIVILQILGI